MIKKFQQKLVLRLVFVFIVINGGAMAAGSWLDAKHIDHVVLMGANSLLFLVGLISLMMHTKALGNKNPNVFVRSIMAATFVKLMVILAAVMIYVVAAGNGRSIGAVMAGLGLYILYTILEVRAALQMNRIKDGSN